MKATVLVGLVLAGASFSAGAQVYKTVDKKTGVHYTYAPPKNIKKLEVPDLQDSQPASRDRARAQQQSTKDDQAARPKQHREAKQSSGIVSTGPSETR